MASRRQPAVMDRSAAVFAALLSFAAAGGASSQDALRPDAQTAPALHGTIQSMISEAWTDATATWSSVLGARLYQTDTPQINFVPAVRASHCYGLYISAGPVYCSGNTTVFVSVASMEELARKIPGVGDAGLAFLVAHELGHHVQKITGRFRVLSELVRAAPQKQREIALHFELEADCLAGVWASNSPKFAATANARTAMLASLDAIGDDRILAGNGRAPDAARFTHGSSEQRVRWFKSGLDSGRIEVCKAMETTAP